MFGILNVGDEVCAGAISFACINEESSFRKLAYHCGVVKHNDRILEKRSWRVPYISCSSIGSIAASSSWSEISESEEEEGENGSGR